MYNLSTIRRKTEPEVIVLLGNKPVEPKSQTVLPFPQKISLEDREFRVAWLRQAGPDYTKVNRLLNRCSGSGMRVQLFEGSDMMSIVTHNRDIVLQADLVLVEAFSRTGNDSHETLLLYVRQYSIAPVVMLTEDSGAEITVAALKAGADAVVLLNMPEEVIIARLHSLLRRWLHANSLSPKNRR